MPFVFGKNSTFVEEKHNSKFVPTNIGNLVCTCFPAAKKLLSSTKNI